MKSKNNIVENVIYSIFSAVTLTALAVAFVTVSPIAAVIAIGGAIAAGVTEIGVSARDNTPPSLNVPTVIASAVATAALAVALLPEAKPAREGIKNLFSDAATVQVQDTPVAKIDPATTYTLRAVTTNLPVPSGT